MGRCRVDILPTGNADHVSDFRALARRADLERALRHGSRSGGAHLAGRHHVAERRVLGPGRRLFAVRLAPHRPRVGSGPEPSTVKPQSCYASRMVMQH
jgi:hypothetical protein